MHAKEFVELAGIVAAHHAALTDGCWRIPERRLEEYWVNSKVRMDRWSRTLKNDEIFGPQVRGAIEEIFAGEVLARTWAAVLAAYDRRRGGDEAEPVARSVMIGLAEARNRALRWLIRISGIDAQAGVELNRLRRRAERWSELFVEEIESPETFYANHPEGRAVERFQAPFTASSPNPDLNARIAASVVGSFPVEVLERAGMSFPLWFAQVMDAADEAQTMIDGLLAEARHCRTG
ncbi:MAG: hypothetical protein JW959_02805 [Pirellulales bacterium]|nr:hypothetical protein [Pirellulales bacterium]